MDMTYLSGRSFSSYTTGIKGEDGKWKVSVELGERVQYPNGTHKQESIFYEEVNEDFDVAHQTALKACLYDLQELVYSRNFDSLIEAKEYDRNLEDMSSVSNVEVNEITKPE